MARYRVEPLHADQAREILGWRYPPPYDFYDPPDHVDPDEFLDPALMFHAVLDGEGDLVGFCSYGKDGRVPGGDYSEDALDIGLGMKPALTGMGLGAEFFEAVLSFGARELGARRFRVTVANFNRRAIRLYRSCGFSECGAFEDSRYNVPYTILVRDDDGDCAP